jgi:putative membrane protein
VRQHVHPLTPLIQALTAIPALGFTAVVLALATNSPITTRVLIIGAAALVLIPVLVFGYSFLAWRRFWFWFDADGDFRVDSGILVRNERRVQLSRLQAVDVVRPIIPRILGFAVVVIEVAGTQDSRVRLRYLTQDQALQLRAEIVARAAGVQPDAGEAPETFIARVPSSRLALALLLRSSTVGLLLLTAAVLTVTVLREGWGGLAIALVTGSLPIALVIGEFIQYAGFTISRSPDGLRMRFGLLQTQTRTVPPGRVQAIEIVEPLLWRWRGWVRIRINIAGVGSGTDQGQRETLMTPVAPRDEALGLIRQLFSIDEPVHWIAAPQRARWRSPVQWSRLAVAVTPAFLHTRRGLVTQHHAMIPHSRTQSVRWTQGPWQRALRLATMWVDSTPGPVRIAALQQDAEQAYVLAAEQAIRAQQARANDPDPRWMHSD